MSTRSEQTKNVGLKLSSELEKKLKKKDDSQKSSEIATCTFFLLSLNGCFDIKTLYPHNVNSLVIILCSPILSFHASSFNGGCCLQCF